MFSASKVTYQNLTQEEKGKKKKYGLEWDTNLSEDEKQSLFEYRKKCYEMRKNNWKVAH